MMNEKYMMEALALAEQGRGSTRPNPLVGALIIKENKIVGRGWHQQYGDAHAEVMAIQEAGEKAAGSTLYVTLEPCAHTGKTPPCTELIIRSGIKEVICAMADPNPLVNGKGIRRLREAGLDVKVGICESEAAKQNAGYIMTLNEQRPYIYGKIAMSLDGKTATYAHDSKWITNSFSRIDSHRLRSYCDAVAVGIETVLSDNPSLTARHFSGAKQPYRVVWDGKCRIPLNCNLLQKNPQHTIIMTGKSVSKEKIHSVRRTGAKILTLPLNEENKLDIRIGLAELVKRYAIQNLLVEGGASLLGSFVDENLLDSLWVYMAPLVIGGKDALSSIGGKGVKQVKNATTFSIEDVHFFEDNLRIIYRRKSICSRD